MAISEAKIQAGARGIRHSEVKRARRVGKTIPDWNDLHDIDKKTDLHEDARACLEAAEKVNV